MRPGNKAKWVVLILVVVCGFLVVRSGRHLSRLSAPADGMEKESDLYLPEVSYLKFISLGHDGLMADLVLAKALTYYGSHYFQRQTFPFTHLKPLFFTAVQLDPMNTDAFLMANNIFSSINIRHSIEILELGMKYHPEYWKFPEMIGFNYFYHLKDPRNAAPYYEQAARLPGHPPYVPSLSSKFYQESGRYEDAVRVLYNFYSTTGDRRLKKSFETYIKTLQEKIRLKQFQLKAVVSGILDAHTIRFQPDRDNPQFLSLGTTETMRLVGIRPYNTFSPSEKERLFAYFQEDYAQMMLDGVSVTLEFERFSDGRLKRDGGGRFQGYVILKDNRSFQVHAVGAGMMKMNQRYPFDEERGKQMKEAVAGAVEGRKGLYGFPPDLIELRDIYKNIGRVVSLRFPVVRVEVREGDIYLFSGSAYRSPFRVVIPMKYVWDEDYFKSLVKRRVTVTGFARLQNREVRINVYLPRQLAVEKRR